MKKLHAGMRVSGGKPNFQEREMGSDFPLFYPCNATNDNTQILFPMLSNYSSKSFYIWIIIKAWQCIVLLRWKFWASTFFGCFWWIIYLVQLSVKLTTQQFGFFPLNFEFSDRGTHLFCDKRGLLMKMDNFYMQQEKDSDCLTLAQLL